jgi:nucleotide-binding universal stress UspA family protein
MTRHILVPLDGSALAETVIPHAAVLARAHNADLILFQVIAPGALRQTAGWGPVPGDVRAGWAETALGQVRAGLDAIAERLQSSGIAVQIEVSGANDVASAIIGRAKRDPDTTMIAMATHGRSGLRRWMLGSVAEKVLQGATTPLLLFRAHEPAASAALSYRTIVVPLDGSLFAEQALDQAKAMAAATGATLVLVAVLPVLDDVALAEVGVVPPWLVAEQQAEMERVDRYLNKTAAQVAAEGFTIRACVVGGTPAEEILRVSAAEHADLIVMATHGWTGLQRLWLGSVATKVVRSADLPVLVVRAQRIPGNERSRDLDTPSLTVFSASSERNN